MAQLAFLCVQLVCVCVYAVQSVAQNVLLSNSLLVLCVYTHPHPQTHSGTTPTLWYFAVGFNSSLFDHTQACQTVWQGAEYSCYRQGHLCLVEALQRTFAFQSLFPTKVHCVSAELNGKSGFESLQLND